jgi:hypothetical protein
MEPLDSRRVLQDARRLRAASRQAVRQATEIARMAGESVDHARNAVQASWLLRAMYERLRNPRRADSSQ